MMLVFESSGFSSLLHTAIAYAAHHHPDTIISDASNGGALVVGSVD
jgi:hypothetical protein